MVEDENIITEFNLFLKNQKNEENNNTSGIKSLSNCWGKIIDKSIGVGNQHFAITINLPKKQLYLLKEEEVMYKEYMYYDKINNYKLDFSGCGQWDDFEEKNYKNTFGNYISLKYSNCFSRDNIISSINKCLYDNFPTTSFLFFITENKNNKYHFHLIISIKNFIDYSYVLKNNLQKYLLIRLQKDFFELDWDIKVDVLLYFKDIKNWIMYMHKEIETWQNKSLLCVNNDNFISCFLTELNYIYNNLIIPYFSFDCYGFFGYLDDYINENSDNFNFLYLLNKDKINGIKLTNNRIDQRVLINLLQYYLILNNYYIYNENIYEKIKESYISYRLIGSIEDILYNKFQENVVKFFLTSFNCYFDNFDFNYLVVNYFIKSKNTIENLIDIITNKIKPDFSLMEFTDGIYSIKYNTFIQINQVKKNKEINNKHTIKYYKKSFNWVRQNKPINWVNGICNALNITIDNIENNENFLKIIKSLSLIFQDEKIKQSTLFIYGPSNSGKTTLITEPIINYLGYNNIGTIISAKNFKWQDLIGKIIGIIDEGRYNQSMSSDLLKISGQENIMVEKKYSKEHIEIKPIPLFIVSNILFEDKNRDINEALKNRMLIVEFLSAILPNNTNNLIKNKIKEEEANIIIYCNKLFFKIFKEKKRKQLLNKIIKDN